MKTIYLAVAVLVLIFLMGLFVVTSDYYLISGSDVVDFSYHYPHWLHAFIAIVIVTLLAVCYRRQVRYLRLLIGFFLLLGLVSSQSLIVSGKSNTINSYLYGIRTGSIAFDPGIGYQDMVKKSKSGYTIISNKGRSLFIITGFCPVCINLDDL